MKRTKRSFRFVVALLLVFSLSFPMTFNAFALTDGNGDVTSNPSNTIEQDSGGDPATTSPDALTTDPPAPPGGGGGADPIDVEAKIPAIMADKVDIANMQNKIIKISDGETSTLRLLSEFETTDLHIDSVIVVNGGEEQARNRDYVSYNESDGYYYTERTNASMTDARVFRLWATYTYDDLGITNWEDLNPSNLTFTYGGKSLDKWCMYNAKTKEFDGDPVIDYSGNIYNIGSNTVFLTVDFLFDEFYPYFNKYKLNIPYEGFTPVTKEGFPVFVRDPSMLGPHDLSLVYEAEEIDSVDIPLNLYDSFHTWDQINDYATELKALSEDDTNKEKNVINGRYVSVKSLAQSQGIEKRDIWNVVIAKDEQSVDDYLTETIPLMETDPETLGDQITSSGALASGYHKSVIYFNNVHPDETPASDAIMELINTFIYENELSYDTQHDWESHPKTKGGYDGYTSQGEANLTDEKSLTVNEVLDQFILVFNITENPDGKDNLVRRNEYGFDLNRDAAYQTQVEAKALTSDLVKWQPMSMLEYHGYVNGLLIEPCTGPHDPNYEYDLYAEKMLAQGNELGRAMIGNTAYSRYLVPATDYSDSWDDGAPVYGPMFAMLFGTMGYTLEIPYSSEDSMEACYTAGLALAKDSLDKRTDYFLNRIEYKSRGINNEDNLAVDSFLKDPYTEEVVGRPRAEGHSFFPEYYVIPVDESIQRNPLEAYKTLSFLERNGALLSVTTEEIDFGGKILPVGTYVIDMHQANRGFVNSMLSDGYDASRFADIYAEIVVSYPDMRNFDCLTVWDEDIFTGKMEGASGISQPETNISGASEEVVIQNDNIDAIRLVNRLLDNDRPVQILTRDFEKPVPTLTRNLENHSKGDFIINRADLEEFGEGLLVYGTSLEGEPSFVKSLIEPEITILGSTAYSRFILDLLGFDDDYSFESDLDKINPESTDVLVSFDDDTNVSGIVSGSGIGFIGIGTYTLDAVKANNLLPGFSCFLPDQETNESYREGLVASHYSDVNLITANYDQTDAAYVMNGTYITRTPFDGEALITISSDSDFFKAGWYPKHDVLKGEMLAVSGFSGSNHDVPVTLFANNIFSKAHAQHTFNMFANAVFLTALDYGTEKPLITASPSSQETLTPSVSVKLEFAADRETVDVKTVDTNEVTIKKYKVTSTETENPYVDENGWKDYDTTTTSIILDKSGVQYIHAYAENTNGDSVQRVFGPYNIGTASNPGNPGGGGGGGSSVKSTAPAITAPAITAPAITFTDISGHWAKTSIEFVVGKKLFSGVSNTLFAPDATMTRGMLVTVLGRAYGLDTAPYSQKSVFTDVPLSAYYAPYVAWAYENKIASGTGEGLFAPDKPVTRGEMAAIIANYMKFIGKGTASTAALTYVDAAEIDSWGLAGVQFVTANGLMTGTNGNNFDFDGLSTRAQVATVMERLLKLIAK